MMEIKAQGSIFPKMQKDRGVGYAQFDDVDMRCF
jgi:hypothetical protein